MFYIIGCARSGTTAIAKILNECKNGQIGIELKPNLCIESRNLYKGILENPKKILTDARLEQIKEAQKFNYIFADKNVNYLPFIPFIDEIWKPKFLFVIRDGKDVVRSLMDWHEYSQGNIFGMYEDDENSPNKSPTDDWWDYSRIRPNKGDQEYKAWKKYTRFEKCTWYWSKYNEILLENYNKLPNNRKKIINMSTIDADTIINLMTFYDLEPLKKDAINLLLKSRINSSKDKYNMGKIFKDKKEWSNDQNKTYDNIATFMETKLKELFA